MISFRDTELRIWEEPGPERGISWSEHVAWERTFKQQVFLRIVRTLRRLGWSVGPGVYIWTDHRARHCTKGDLKADLVMKGRCIELTMFQSINTPTRPDHDGRHEWNKRALMPYVMRMEMERTRRRIRDLLCAAFPGYSFEAERPPVGLMGCTALEKVTHDRLKTGHYVPELGRARINVGNDRARDGGTIVHGAKVFAEDSKGRIVTGVAYYSLNNNWDIVTGRYGLLRTHTGHIYANDPGQLRTKRNDRLRRRRLEQELKEAVAAMNFERAKVLRDLLFPASAPVFHIKTQDGLLFGPDYCGYTKDPQRAGWYTEAELSSYRGEITRGEFKAVPVQT